MSTSDDRRTELTRRELLRRGAAGALVIGAGSLAGSGVAGAEVLDRLASAPKRGGVLRMGINGGSTSDDMDMAHVNGTSSGIRDQAFYETLTYLDNHFKLDDHFLCQECSPEQGGAKWIVRVKDGVEFHNGKTLTSDDVLFSIKRILDPKSGATAAGQLAGIDMKQTRKRDKRTVEFVLKTPTSFFDQLLSDIVYMVPVGYDPKSPVSTGPWVFKSFQAGRQTIFTRFANYHGTPAYADELHFIELPDDTARVNALISGQVDGINEVPAAQLSQVKGQSNIQLANYPTGRWNPITMRVDVAPFNDVRVRQALRLVMDRNQAIQVALYGQGVPAADFYGRFDPSFDSSLHREQDIDQAKSLLKSAGQQNLHVQLVVSPIVAGIVQASQVLAENAKKAGVTIDVKQVDLGTFFARYGKWPFAVDIWPGLPYMVTASIADGPDSNVVNVTHFRDKEYNALYKKASSQLSLKERTPTIHEMQRIQYERGGHIVWSFQNQTDAYSTKLGGVQLDDETGWGLGRCVFQKMYFT